MHWTKFQLPLGGSWSLPFLKGFALAALAVSLWLTTTMTSCPSLVQLLKQVCASVMYSVPGKDTCTGKQASDSGLQHDHVSSTTTVLFESRHSAEKQLSGSRHQTQ